MPNISYKISSYALIYIVIFYNMIIEYNLCKKCNNEIINPNINNFCKLCKNYFCNTCIMNNICKKLKCRQKMINEIILNSNIKYFSHDLKNVLIQYIDYD